MIRSPPLGVRIQKAPSLSLKRCNKLVGADVALVFQSFLIRQLSLSRFGREFFNPRTKLEIDIEANDSLSFWLRQNLSQYGTDGTVKRGGFGGWIHASNIAFEGRQSQEIDAGLLVLPGDRI
ncbi:hypothetical protein [Stieleria varia]|uniref:hypothetical protein n=1 Tax=Stieleria varia TaxID=2528005 RepID=UPI0011B3F64B|nr:hypothetical protein [Stieleria varia]